MSDTTSVADRLRAAGCVFADDEAAVLVASAASAGELASMVARRERGEPLERVVGWAAFGGLRIEVDPGVFVPRRRTELLARQAAAAALAERSVVVDLCCGAGAIGAVVLAAVGAVELHAVDVDPRAVACARRNLGTGAHVYEGDLFAPLPADRLGRVDVVVANVPYVPTAAIALLPAEARDHEARVALDGGPDGLDVVRRIAGSVGEWLAPAGTFLVETSVDQAPSAIELLARHDLVAATVRDDDLDATVLVARRSA
jgi:release factor glutamine methyltransferase